MTEYATLAEALAATDPDTNVWVHVPPCKDDPCTCLPFKVPSEDLKRLGAEAVAAKLAPLVKERA